MEANGFDRLKCFANQVQSARPNLLAQIELPLIWCFEGVSISVCWIVADDPSDKATFVLNHFC